MPQFQRRDVRGWIDQEEMTANFIRYFWTFASNKERQDISFLIFIMKCGWTNNNREGGYSVTTREWRNKNLSDYLGISDDSLLSVKNAALTHWSSMRIEKLKKMLKSHTGITHYYPPYRTEALNYAKRHKKKIADIFNIVASNKLESIEKISKAMNIICSLPIIKTPSGGNTSILNAISPSLACVDPQEKFPIMNQRTDILLKFIGRKKDAEGAISLYELIGHYNIHSNLELDIYSQHYASSFPIYKKRSKRRRVKIENNYRNVGLKSEEDSYAEIGKKKINIRKEHNKLTNMFGRTMLGRYTLEEGDFDILISDWKKGKMLLIEAKTSSEGAGGRSQVRQAIGQLFDYRKNNLDNNPGEVELAVLLPQKPKPDIIDLLASIDIHVLWFSNNRLKGTIEI